MKPLYIFDLDGTLALIDHRRHFVQSKNKDWKAFYEACIDDLPNEKVIKTLKILLTVADVYIFSGREDSVRLQTLKWLRTYTGKDWSQKLLMRPVKDQTPDDELKLRWYSRLSKSNKERLVAVFDDRQKVVDMWRSQGITCFQVAEGDF